MTAEEAATQRFQDDPCLFDLAVDSVRTKKAMKRFRNDPYFEVMVQSIAKKAAKYAYARIKLDETLGTGNEIDDIIREKVFQTIKRFDV